MLMMSYDNISKVVLFSTELFSAIKNNLDSIQDSDWNVVTCEMTRRSTLMTDLTVIVYFSPVVASNKNVSA